MLGKGAVYLAASGFGYGDDTGVQLHDRLIGFFAGQLDGAVTVGDALTRAKQQYFSTQGLYGTYDDKVLESMNLFGLPFYRLGQATVTRPTLPDVVPPFSAELKAINCHHNYVARESHYGQNVLITRKGAVRAREGDMGIIPGSMGARSYIVRGKGNPESFSSCAHGAGRRMSRTEAKRRFSRV